MTPEQKIRYLILLKAIDLGDGGPFETITEDNVDELFEELEESWDARSEVREGEFATDILAPYSRHYESKSVASQLPDGSYVGWTYWYGGGKHGEPDAIDWIEDAYDLTVTEEQKLVTVRTWGRAP
jgi:hypothetical protein